MSDIRATERRNPRTADIDLATPREIVSIINAEDHQIADAVASQADQIAKAIAIAEDTFRDGGRLLYIGAGTSGRLGVLDASECPPTFGTDPKMVQGIIAGGLPALIRSQEGAEDDQSAGADAMDDRSVGPRDFIVGIAASGTTPYVAAALKQANVLGAKTAIVACSPPPETLLKVVDVAIVVLVGPEVVTGSTRMKAGTATKLVLNTITTGAMIRIGKTYGNLMVDVQATNAKLTDRAERIVMDVCDLPRDQARMVLESAGRSVKTAITMQLLGIGRVEAERRLHQRGGVIRNVVQNIAPPPVDAW